MTKLAVIGPGLLGGSIALAARRAGNFHVSAWARRAEAVEELSHRFADVASTDLRKVATDADIVVLCVPIGVMPALARELEQIIPQGAIVTDVGSVKAPVVAELAGIFRNRGTFIGSHPMAGSEQTGLKAARKDLFDRAVCIVTPEASSSAAAIADITHFWETLGCRVTQLSPEAHDEIVAEISHFPHLLAALVVHDVEKRNPAAFDFIGPGFRDMTRIAGGPPEMWTEILRVNRVAVKKSAEAMIEKLQEVLKLLDRSSPEGDFLMNEFLSQAKVRRDSLRLPATPGCHHPKP